MTARILAGKDFAARIKADAKQQAEKIKEKYGVAPGLAVVIVGTDPASQVYVRNKHKACAELGLYSEVIELPADTAKDVLLAKIDALNKNPKIHGILVQLPLPKALQAAEAEVLDRIDPKKDVDGISPANTAKVYLGDDKGFAPCTAEAVMEIIDSIDYDLQGKKVVIVGCGNVVGKPLSLLMFNRNATVTVCNEFTKELKDECVDADVIVAAAGVRKLINADHVSPDCMVIDVGINTDENGKLCGDVDFETVAPIVKTITPVPGGVGSVTTTVLAKHVIKAAEEQHK